MKIRPQVYTTPGQILLEFVSECRPKMLVETGCLRRNNAGEELSDGWSTLYLANWISKNGGHLISIDVDKSHIDVARGMLHRAGFLDHVTFICGESVEELKKLDAADFAYLDTSDDLVHGKMEFQQAERMGSKVIVMDDHESKVVLAEKYALEHGWEVEQDGRFTVMRRAHGA